MNMVRGIRASILLREVERVGVVHAEEDKALGIAGCSLLIPKRGF